MTDPPRGRLIALEGVDGCGKSTQSRLLATSLGAELTFEPGATDLGRELRTLLLGRSDLPVDPHAEALLMAADRAQHVAEVIEPALRVGRWVVTDRYSASTLAYQGWGRGLDPVALRALLEWATGGLWPDLTILIDLPLEDAQARLSNGVRDRLERLDGAFFERVRAGFLAQAEKGPEPWIVIDGRGDVESIAEEIVAEVEHHLGVRSGK